jgi:hypothetical protein
MQFHAIRTGKAGLRQGEEAASGPVDGRTALEESALNLLKHIPGEASGFYLLAAGAFEKPSVTTLGILFALALVILLVVRLSAKASIAITLTTLGAFVIWMFAIDQGFFQAAFPSLLPAPMGLVLAAFYSTIITTLAGAGKIK